MVILYFFGIIQIRNLVIPLHIVSFIMLYSDNICILDIQLFRNIVKSEIK